MRKPIQLNNKAINRWMDILLRRADETGIQGEIPICAIVLDHQGNCIGHGRNRRNRDGDPLGHAEIIALKQAASLKNDWRLNDCTLIVTLEPCPMCAGALIQARMGKVIYGAKDLKRGALGGVIDLSKDPSSHHNMDVIGGILEEQASFKLKEWFKEKRKLSL